MDQRTDRSDRNAQSSSESILFLPGHTSMFVKVVRRNFVDDP